MGAPITLKKLLAVLSIATLLAALVAVAPWAGDPAQAQEVDDLEPDRAGDEDGSGDDGSSTGTGVDLDAADPARDAAEANNEIEFAGIGLDGEPTGPQEEDIERRELSEDSSLDPLAPPAAVAAQPVLPGPPLNDPDQGTSSTISFEDSAVDVNVDTLPEVVAIEIQTGARSRIVELSAGDLLSDLQSESVSFELFDGARIDVTTLDAPSEGALESTIYRGNGADGQSIITELDGEVIGQFFTPNGQFGIAPIPDSDLHVVFEIDRDFPNGGEPAAFPSVDNGPSGLTVQELAGDGDVVGDVIGIPAIDIMIAFDAEAATFYGNNIDTMRLNAAAMVNQANAIYRNTNSGQHLNLTHIFQTNVTPNTTSGFTYRNQLASKTDGNFDNVHPSRDSNGSDLIALISNRFVATGLCGIAFFPDSANPAENDAYSVTEASCALGGLTFTHELGHNQCAGHDVQGTTCNYNDDEGHRNSAANVRTVMARNSNPENRVPVFSNPGVNFPGTNVPAGVTGVADNHRVMELEDCDTGGDSGGLANYRAPSGCSGQTSIAGVDGASCIFSSLDDAINNAAAGATIYVSPGTHAFEGTNANGNINRNLTIEQGSSQCANLASGQTATDVVIQPSPGTTVDSVLEIFNGASLVLRDLTVENGVSAEGTVFVSNGDVTLDNVVIRNGDNPSTTVGGGGLRIGASGSATSINNSQIINNTAAAFGGGVYVSGGSFTMDGIDDVENNTAANGGGIAAINGATVLMDNNADVLGNTATSDGGGIYVSGGSTVTLDGVNGTQALNNTATRGGGAFVDGAASTLLVDIGDIRSNTALFGGGVYLLGGTFQSNSEGDVVNNTASTNGGGILSGGNGTVILNGTATVNNNSTAGQGGGVWISTGTLTAAGFGSSQVLITNNSANGAVGGGIMLSAGTTATLDTVRVAGNSAATNGGGIWIANNAEVEELSSCGAISTAFERYCNEFASNTAQLGGAIYIAGGDVQIEQAAFIGNEATVGGEHAIAAVGSSTLDLEASILLSNSPTLAGNGSITFSDSASGSLLAVTFTAPAENGLDLDGTGSVRVDRVLNAGGELFAGGVPFTGICNLDISNANAWGNAGVTVANPQFQTTVDSQFVPGAPQALDECNPLGRATDIGDQSVINSDGVASSTEYEIGAWEAPLTATTGPTCNGLPVTVQIGLGQNPTGGNDVILGTAGPDVIVASTGDDTICGLGGDDTINGGPGNDWVDAGAGDDSVFGLDGADTVFGRSGDDVVIGGNGNDSLNGEAGTDRLNGGLGNDQLVGGADRDFLFAQAGNDNVQGGAGDDLILGVDGIDTINGGAGDDTINAGPGTDTVNGGDGDDTILGLGGSDTLNGNGGNDNIFGGVGSDNINGGVGDDQLLGNENNDTITDPSGTNTINGGFGDDDLTGGTGIDRIFGDADNTQNGDDFIDGGLGADQLNGFAGQDTIIANDGVADTVNGGPDVDVCTTDGIDTVFNCP